MVTETRPVTETPVSRPRTIPVEDAPAVRIAPVEETPVVRIRPVEEFPAVRIAPVETRPVVPAIPEPVDAVLRFIDTIIPPVVVESEGGRVAVIEGPVSRVDGAGTDTAMVTPQVTTEDSAPQVRLPTEEPPPAGGTREEPLPPDATVTPETAPELRRGAIVLNDGRSQMVFQETGLISAPTLTIMDPFTAKVMVCANEPIPTLMMDDAGFTSAVVLADGTILTKPVDVFKSAVRADGLPLADDVRATVCNLSEKVKRLSLPENIIRMPKLSETERELIPARVVVGVGGRVLIVAADNTTEKTLRGIAVRVLGDRLENSTILYKPFPDRNQQPLSVRGVAVEGDLPGRINADLMLTDRSGTTTTQRCEFSKDTDMVCTVLQRVGTF